MVIIASPSPHFCSVLDRDASSQEIPELPVLQNSTRTSHDGATMSHDYHPINYNPPCLCHGPLVAPSRWHYDGSWQWKDIPSTLALEHLAPAGSKYNVHFSFQ